MHNNGRYNRGFHSNNNYNNYGPQNRHNYYREAIPSSQFQHNYYRQMNVPQHQYDQIQTSGYPQRPTPSQQDRPSTSRNQNLNRSPQEKTKSNQEDYKYFTCPACAQYFEFYRNNRNPGRVPLILNCQHTVCQECISKSAVGPSIICPICRKSSDLPNRQSLDNLQEIFIPNFYILGIIAWSRPQGNNMKQISLVPTQVTLNKKKIISLEQPPDPPEPQGEKCCFLSCYKKAVLRCKDCNDVFCAECCTLVHKNVKSFWSHVQVQITNTNFSAELDKCLEHGAMDVEFFCNTCETAVCCYCFIEKHEGHGKEYLSKLDSEELNQFELYKEKAEQVLHQLNVSKKKLKDLSSGSTASVEKKICSYFADIHGRLCFIQKRLLKELSEGHATDASSSSGSSLLSDLASSINLWSSVLAGAENVNVKKMNLRQILLKLKEVEKARCYLLGGTDNLNLTEFYPDPILENLDDLFKIAQPKENDLRLVSEDELPPDYVKDLPDTHESERDSISSSRVSSSKKEQSNLFNKKLSSQPLSSHPKTKNSGQNRRSKLDKTFITDVRNVLQIPLDNEMVEVTHIESLECFYVQLKKHQSLFIQMSKDIENYVKMGASKVTSPQINELYVAMYVTKTEKIWCRGRLVDIKSQETEALYEIYFLDFGNTQTLDIQKLREITPYLAQKKPFAVQCELYNPTNASWGKNAHVYMGKVINGKELYMVVKNVNNGVYQVDLMVSSSDRGLTSVIDILIHTCSNVLSSSSDSLNSVQQKISYIPQLKIFSNSFKFHKNQAEKVTLANIIDPHNIFVHIAGYVDLLKSMIVELKQNFKNKMLECCIPVEGTYVLVEFRDPIRGNWHRALVKKVDMLQRNAHVLLVDWGIVVVVPWTDIKMLTDNFTRLECQAILVKLAHVEPHQGSQAWSDSAIFFLQKNFRTQEPLKMIVHSVDPLEVSLYEIVGSVNICINTQLVQEKFADSTGKISQILEWPEDDISQTGFSEEEGFVEGLLKKVDESPEEESEGDEADDYVKQQIDVVKVDSPDLIYIKFMDLEEQEKNMYKELQVHYNKSRKPKDTWNEDEACVVQLPDCFVRGKILCHLGDSYTVDLYDKALEVTLPKENIFVYSDYFKKFPKFVYKCHLANIRPAGGNRWSLTSIEALEKIFDKYKDIYATKIPGNPAKKYIPMLMWYTQTKVCNALEPFVTRSVSINKLLVKLGFAYKEDTIFDGSSDGSMPKFDDPKSESTIIAPVHSPADDLNDSAESAESENDLNIKEKSVSFAKPSIKSIDWNDLMEEEQRAASHSKQDPLDDTREAEIIDWKPAFPIEKQKFEAWITCADPEGILYLRDIDLQVVYKNMEATMKEYFDSHPPLAEKCNWQPGQICTISYNDKWYRGKIIKVNSPEEVVALMIDFGSDHTLSTKVLYREILYPEIPAFASKIKLDKIYSKTDAWLSSDYDTLLDVVTEYATVEIKGSLDDEIPLAEVYTDKGQSINQLLVKLCPNLSRQPVNETEAFEEEHVLIEAEDSLNLNEEDGDTKTTAMEFNVQPLPDEAFEDKIPMHIAFVLAYNKLVLKTNEDDYEDLISLNTDIQQCCAEQPTLKDLEIGMPCICPYTEDGLWYRARIQNIEGIDCGYVFVFFVDFGNVESISVDNIKEMKPEWFDLPVSCYIAEINIELKTDNHIEHVLQHMKKLFNKTKLVHFVSKDPLVVDIHEKDGELCYQSLINNGLLK